MTGCIYCYTYLPTDEKYIGQSINIQIRKYQHQFIDKQNEYFHTLLRNEPENFLFEILEDNIDIQDLDNKEREYISLYNTYKGKGFNKSPGGTGGWYYINQYFQEHPQEKKISIQRMLDGAKKWRKDNPEKSYQINIKNLEKANEYWKTHPEENQKRREKIIASRSKQVMCINTGIIYPSAAEAGRQLHIDPSQILKVCKGQRKSAGKDKNNNKLYWKEIKKDE